jgi:hypothetical protein
MIPELSPGFRAVYEGAVLAARIVRPAGGVVVRVEPHRNQFPGVPAGWICEVVLTASPSVRLVAVVADEDEGDDWAEFSVDFTEDLTRRLWRALARHPARRSLSAAWSEATWPATPPS